MEDQPKRRGRPPTDSALTGAERVKAHRTRKRAAAVAAFDKKPENVIARLRTELDECRRSNAELKAANATLNARLAEANTETRAARDEVERLKQFAPPDYRPSDYYPRPR